MVAKPIQIAVGVVHHVTLDKTAVVGVTVKACIAVKTRSVLEQHAPTYDLMVLKPM